MLKEQQRVSEFVVHHRLGYGRDWQHRGAQGKCDDEHLHNSEALAFGDSGDDAFAFFEASSADRWCRECHDECQCD